MDYNDVIGCKNKFFEYLGQILFDFHEIFFERYQLWVVFWAECGNLYSKILKNISVTLNLNKNLKSMTQISRITYLDDYNRIKLECDITKSIFRLVCLLTIFMEILLKALKFFEFIKFMNKLTFLCV